MLQIPYAITIIILITIDRFCHVLTHYICLSPLITYIFLIPVSFWLLDDARVIDTHLELDVDFDEKVLKGKAILTIEKKSSADKVVSKYFLLYFIEQKFWFIIDI